MRGGDGRRTVVRLCLSGEHAGTTDLLAQNLPGYPDNMARGSDGLVWLTIASPVDPLVELLRHQAPMVVRKAVTRVPEVLQPKPRQNARVQAFDDAGRLVHDLDADAASYHMVTGVREHQGEGGWPACTSPRSRW